MPRHENSLLPPSISKLLEIVRANFNKNHVNGRQAELLTLMLLVANLANTKWGKKAENDWNPGKWVLIWHFTQLSNEYQHDRVKMVIKNLCIIAISMKLASALEGLTISLSPK